MISFIRNFFNKYKKQNDYETYYNHVYKRQMYVKLCPICNNKIYVIGGYNINLKTEFAINQIFDPKTNSWTTGSPMITAKHGHCASVVDNKIYVIGGAIQLDAQYQNEVFDPKVALYYLHCRITSKP